ncbi:hypothetical protein ACU4GD_23750 [Cupriavidus basilensis]
MTDALPPVFSALRRAAGYLNFSLFDMPWPSYCATGQHNPGTATVPLPGFQPLAGGAAKTGYYGERHRAAGNPGWLPSPSAASRPPRRVLLAGARYAGLHGCRRSMVLELLAADRQHNAAFERLLPADRSSSARVTADIQFYGHSQDLRDTFAVNEALATASACFTDEFRSTRRASYDGAGLQP